MITFEEIELRGPELEDVKTLHQNISEAEINPLLANAYYPLSTLGIEEFLKRKADDARDKNGYLFAIYVEGEGPLGILELGNINWKARHVELSMWVSKGFRERGYEKKAALAALHFAFKELGMHKVCARCLETDLKLCQFYEHTMAFAAEGKLREQNFHEGKHLATLLFGLLDKEYATMFGENNVAISPQKTMHETVRTEFEEGSTKPEY